MKIISKSIESVEWKQNGTTYAANGHNEQKSTTFTGSLIRGNKNILEVYETDLNDL